MDFRRFVQYQPLAVLSVMQVFMVGFGAGLVTWLGYIGLQKYLSPLVCTSDSLCGTAPMTMLVLVLLMTQFIALVALIRIGVLRPLLVVIASLLTLWGFHVWLASVAWWLAAIYAAILFGLAYVVYAWINRLLEFPVALILTILGIVAARVLLASW